MPSPSATPDDSEPDGARPGTVSEPTTGSTWVTPVGATVVVALVAFVILGILGVALLELAKTPGKDSTVLADPNAGTIAAIASAAFTSLSSLTAAYFGIRVANEASARATDTAQRALAIAGNSTGNGNPNTTDF